MLSIVATEPNCYPNFTLYSSQHSLQHIAVNLDYDQNLGNEILYLLDVSMLKQNIDPIDRRFLIKIIVIQY